MLGIRLALTGFAVGLLQLCSLSAQSAWTQISPQAPIPPPRYAHTTVYNPTSNRLIVFAGAAGPGGSYTNDVWVMTNANGVGTPSWIQLFANGAPGSPAPRVLHSAVYDAATNRMIVFGGFSPGLAEYNDVWVLTNADGTGGTPAWIPLIPSGSTPARCSQGAVYDAASNRMLIFLGDTTGYQYPGFANTARDVWALTHANGLGGTPAWIQLSPTGTPPPGRWVTQIDSAYDPATNRLMLYGGSAGKPNDRFAYGDTWVLTNANGLTGTPVWQQLNPTGATPLARSHASGFYDSATNRLVIHGGTVDPGDYPSLSDTWILSNANGIGTPFWQQVLPQGTQIPARRLHVCVYDRLRNLMVVYGGQLTAGSSLPSTSETWVLSNANGLGVSQQLRIDAITPNHGGNVGAVTVRITGAGFQSGTTIKLTGMGQDILGTKTQFIDSGVLLTTFDLSGATPGSRTVVVSNSNNATVSLALGFMVDEGGAAQIWVDIVGRDKIRIGSNQTFYITYGNRGNVDSAPSIISVVVPTSVDFSVDVSQPLIGTLTSGSNNVLAFALGSVPAGGSGAIPINLNTTAPANSVRDLRRGSFLSTITGSFQLRAFLNLVMDLPAATGADFEANLPCAFFSTCDSQCASLYLRQLQVLDLARSQFDVYINSSAAATAKLAELGADRILAGAKATLLGYIIGQLVGAIGLASEGGALGVAAENYISGAITHLISATQAAYGGSNPTNVQELQEAALDVSQASTSTATILQLEQSNRIFEELADQINSLVDFVRGIVEDMSARSQEYFDLRLARQDAFNTFQVAAADFCRARNNVERCHSSLGSSATPCGSQQQPLPPSDSGDDRAMITITPVSSLDPNDKVGPQGVGAIGYLASAKALRYSIYFENEPNATAPAQSVTVTDKLNNNIDLTTLTLGPISFLNQLITPPSVPPSATSFATTVDLRPATNLLVKINAALNATTGVLTWTLQSLDPATNEPPNDPLVGFLQPGAEGSVFFMAMPKSTVTTGTILQNTASVVFDANPPIATPTWSNAIDNTKPTSHVNSLAVTQTSKSFPVQWLGSDIGSGVRDFTVYVSDNGGPYIAWLTNTTATQAIYSGINGHTVAFYSIARDLVGNIETSKSTAEANTTIKVPPTIQCTGCYLLISGTRATIAFNVNPVGANSTFSYNYRTTAQTVQFVGTTISQFSVNGNTVTFTGQGNLNGQTGYNFTVTATDGGSIGSGLDTVSFSITGPDSYSYSARGTIFGGDIVVQQ